MDMEREMKRISKLKEEQEKSEEEKRQKAKQLIL